MASCNRKRAREEDISIRVAAGQPLAAESFVLRAVSSCARALPADAQEWDVSGLLAEDGQPFSRETVSCVVACAYGLVDGMAQLEPQDISQLSTVTGLTQVLAFADAVGSSVGLVDAACSQLQRLQFVVQLPEQTLELPVGDSCCIFAQANDADSHQLRRGSLKDVVDVGSPLSAEQRRDVQQQVAKQLELLLRTAHTLRLQPLLDVLHRFILPNSVPGSACLLTGVMSLVFSDAVLEAALGSGTTLSREAYVSSVVSQPCSLTPGKVGHASLLKPIGPKTWDADSEALMFDAVLLRDFAGGTAGDTVKVGLYLFGRPGVTGTQGFIRLSGETYLDLPIQLLVGHSVSDAAALEAFLKP